MSLEPKTDQAKYQEIRGASNFKIMTFSKGWRTETKRGTLPGSIIFQRRLNIDQTFLIKLISMYNCVMSAPENCLRFEERHKYTRHNELSLRHAPLSIPSKQFNNVEWTHTKSGRQCNPVMRTAADPGCSNTMLEAELKEVSWRNAMPGTLTLRCLLETQPACYLVSPPLYNADGVAHWYYGRNSTATIDKRAEGGGNTSRYSGFDPR